MKIKFLALALLAVVLPTHAAEPVSAFTKTKQEGSLVYYAGTGTLEGEFWYPIAAREQEVIGNQLCFNVSDQDVKLIPRDADDQRSAWFCFKDTEEAAKQLGLTEFAKKSVCEIKGKATVEITNYVVDREETDTNDRAELVNIMKKPDTLTIKLAQEDGSTCEE